MKISKKELEQIINEAVGKKVATLKESTDFTAKRRIVYAAQNASMEFENEIAKSLGLIDADQLPSNLQIKYFQYAEEMKADIIRAVVAAVGKFATLPRNQTGASKKAVK